MISIKDPESFTHGTRGRYVAGCRCVDCIRSNRIAYHERQERAHEAASDLDVLPPVPVTRTWTVNGVTKTRIYQNGCPGIRGSACPTGSVFRKGFAGGICAGCRSRLVWNGLVPATQARAHLIRLSRCGIGRRAVHAATDISQTILSGIRSRKKKMIRARTETLILEVDTSAVSNQALVGARPAQAMIAEMIRLGLTRDEIAERLGKKGLRLRKKIRAVTAFKIEKLLQEVRVIHEMNVPVICSGCGFSHKNSNRRRLIARMVREGFAAQEIRDAWPCFYPDTAGGERSMYRDIKVLKQGEELS